MQSNSPLVVTPGEPAGIGPDLLLQLAAREDTHDLVVVADPDLLRARARLLGIDCAIRDYAAAQQSASTRHAAELRVLPLRCAHPPQAGQLDKANAGYVLATLDRAMQGCLRGEFAALVTGPVHKGCINEAGIPFTGHTEYLAAGSGTRRVVMMLANRSLRVALVTTHLPLKQVSDAITPDRLTEVIRILHRDLRDRFGLPAPRIRVCGLNPHAGEDGHLGDEEIRVIRPVLDALRGEGMDLAGPVPADTAFIAPSLRDTDAVLAMFHDQGLPVLKHSGFGEAVNITLGLPFIRTSVDHGTALHLAGTGRADVGSLRQALRIARDMAAGGTGPAIPG